MSRIHSAVVVRAPATWMTGCILSVAALLLLPLAAGSTSAPAATAAEADAKCAVKITSVTGITYKNLDSTITVSGQCFGVNPVYIPLKPFGYTGKDTYDCGGPVNGPSLVIYDTGRGDWAAGHFFGQDAYCTGTNAIGLKYISWTNTQIVIHGFGDGLGLPGSSATWIMYPGDACSVQVTHDHFGSRYTYALPSGEC